MGYSMGVRSRLRVEVRYETAHHVLQLYQREYRSFNVRCFHEELTEKGVVSVSYTWTKNLLLGRVWWSKRRSGVPADGGVSGSQ